MSSPLPSGLPEHLRARYSAQRRQTGIQLLALSIAAACIAGAGFLLRPMNAIRKERQLVIDPESIKGLPPDLSLLGKLGTFRALAIDWASIRAERLKDEGKTYEALQLHETVCALAPRFPNVWVNAAWNMAYNISVMKYTPEERWQWVKNGIEVLRDRGLLWNPKAVALYKELTWIYWHKIGDILDDEHLNYKRALAVEMERVLGPPPVTLTDQEYFDWFQRIVDAPHDLTGLIEGDAEIARLVSRLRSVKLDPGESLLEFVAVHIRPELRVSDLLRDHAGEDPMLKRRIEVVTDPKEQEALQRLLAAVRSKVLRERYKFDLSWMLKLMNHQYGPLDWRNGYAHALYWSSLGDAVTREQEAASRHDKLNTARFVFFALQSMVMRGKIVLWPNFQDAFASYIEFTPDTRLIPYLFDTYLRLGKEHFGDDPRFKEGTPGPIYMNGFVTQMHNWVELLYLEGGEENLKKAENFYAWLRENNPHPDGQTQEQYQGTVEEFVMGDLLDQLQTFRAAHAIVRRFVFRAMKEWSLGLQREAAADLGRARMCYDFWMEDTRRDPNERRKMQPFVLVLRDEMESFFKEPQIAPLAKARLWKELPVGQRQMVYDRLRSYFQKLAENQNPPWDVDRAFGEPPGMEEFRKTEIETHGAPRREGVEEGELDK